MASRVQGSLVALSVIVETCVCPATNRGLHRGCAECARARGNPGQDRKGTWKGPGTPWKVTAETLGVPTLPRRPEEGCLGESHAVILAVTAQLKESTLKAEIAREPRAG